MKDLSQYSNEELERIAAPVIKQKGFLEKAADSPPIHAIQGAQDAVEKMFSFGMLPKEPQAQGTSYNVGNVLGNIGSFFAGGELLSPIAKSAPFISKALGGEGLPAQIMRRVSGGAIAGASENPEDRVKGSVLGGLMSAGAEAVPLAFKGLGALSETINPYKFTAKLIENIKNEYNAAKNEVSSLFNPILNKFSKHEITAPKIGENIEKHFGPKINSLYEDFKSNPTLKNAHDLQSQLGIESAALFGGKKEAYTRKTIEAYNEARKSIKSAIESFLNRQGGDYANKYRVASDIFKEKVVPYRAKNLVRNIAEGNQKTAKPSKLYETLNTLYENNTIKPNHYLSHALSELSKKVQIGQGIGTAGSAVGGFLSGGIPGAIAGKIFAPSVIDLVTNPAISNFISKLNIPYDRITKAIIANKLQGL